MKKIISDAPKVISSVVSSFGYIWCKYVCVINGKNTGMLPEIPLIIMNR